MERIKSAITRPPMDSDQENCQKVMSLITNLIDLNPGIEGAIWVSAFATYIAQDMFISGLTKEQFSHEMDRLKSAYATVWEEWEKSYEYNSN